MQAISHQTISTHAYRTEGAGNQLPDYIYSCLQDRGCRQSATRLYLLMLTGQRVQAISYQTISTHAYRTEGAGADEYTVSLSTCTHGTECAGETRKLAITAVTSEVPGNNVVSCTEVANRIQHTSWCRAHKAGGHHGSADYSLGRIQQAPCLE